MVSTDETRGRHDRSTATNQQQRRRCRNSKNTRSISSFACCAARARISLRLISPRINHINIMAKTVVLETSMGDITLELYANHAPRTCLNFYSLAQYVGSSSVTTSAPQRERKRERDLARSAWIEIDIRSDRWWWLVWISKQTWILRWHYLSSCDSRTMMIIETQRRSRSRRAG